MRCTARHSPSRRPARDRRRDGVGVRPAHIQLTDDGAYRGEVMATEYLGTTQIVTLATAGGEVKARISSRQVVRVGETLGLQFDPQTVTLFDPASGRALKSELNEGVLDG